MRDMGCLNQEHRDYINDRMLDWEDAEAEGIETYNGKIAFSYGDYRKLKLDQGRYIALPKGLPHKKLWREDKVANLPITERTVLIITEGEFDALAVMQTGHEHVVSLPDGSKSTGSIKTDEGALKPFIERYSRILLLMDNDAPGREAKEQLCQMIGASYCYEVNWPAPNIKDANQVLVDRDRDALADMLRNMKSMSGLVVYSAADISDKDPVLLERFKIPKLEEHMCFGVPNFTVVGAEANIGKSVVLQIMVYELMLANPHLKLAMFYGEGDKRLVKQRIRKFCIDRGVDADDWLRNRIFILDLADTQSPTFEWLLAQMEHAALCYGANVIVVDPWNEILPERDVRQNKTDWIAESIVRMKGICKRLEINLFIGHHTRIPKNPGEMPDKYELEGSHNWSAKTDHIVMLARPNKGKPNDYVEMNVCRIREVGILGEYGSVRLYFNEKRFALEDKTFSADN